MKFLFLLIPAALIITWVNFDSNESNAAGKDFYNGLTPMFCMPSFDPAKLNAENAPIFNGLGDMKYEVSTSSKKAEQYFNQGLTLLYAFNHGEAGRSFKAAISLDPQFAMAYWGLAMVLGPNYNAALNPTSLDEINEAVDKAIRYAGQTKPHEQALIHAISKRFPTSKTEDMAPFNAAYAASMKKAHETFPDDVQIATLYADALMNEHPWDLWLRDGTPQPWTPEILEILEKTMEKYPDHPGANHMYIHATEASSNAGRALPSADKLRYMLPAAGHLVHMPSHIYIRTGHYHEGVLANERASMADSSYISQCKVSGTYPMMYYPHNIHFLAACAYLEGNSKKAVDAAWSVSRNADKKFIKENATIQHYYSIPFYVLVKTGKWEDILEMTKPDAGLKYPVAIWHYARGMAFAAKNDLASSIKEQDIIKRIAKDEVLKTLAIWQTNSAHDLVQIALHVLSAEIAEKQNKLLLAIEHLRKAIEIEDSLLYQEPPDWFFSVRQSLGHTLHIAGNLPEAEAIYLEDLQKFPENGWSLMGLYQVLKKQNRMQEAKDVKKRFDKAWQWSDMEITSSRVF